MTSTGLFALVAAHIWQSTLFAAVATLLALALRRNQARVRYWIWTVASYKFLIPFSWLVTIGHLFRWRAAPVTIPSIFLTNLSADMPAPDHSLAMALFIGAVWSCGFVVVTAGWAREWLRIRAIVRAASPIPLGLPIPVRSTAARLEPGVFGIARPVLLLPEGIAARLTQMQLHAVLAHELCHVRRRDNLTAALHMAVEAIFWFHPLVWWLGVRLIHERERACDEDVLQAGSEAQAYAESILKVCEFYLESPLTCISGITGSDLKKRMERIMRNHIGETMKIHKKLLLWAVGLAALALPVAIGTITAPSLSAQGQTYQAGKNGVGYPTCAYCPNPKYSDAAIKAHYEGVVTLRAVITAEGRATSIRVVKSPGLGLDKEAVDVMKRWRFNPAKQADGTAVSVEVPIEVTFRLPVNQR